MKDRVLLPHSPSHNLTWKLDRDYSPITNNWESIDKFLFEVTKGDAQLKQLLIAACAAVMQGRSDLQKALYLFGSGGNGKGSFLRLLEMLVGDENCHSTTLESLCENRFEVANLYNKRLTICPDEDRRIRGFSVFKSVTGGDSLRGEEKGMKAFKFKYQGMVVLASNEPVFVGDNSYGLSRRLIPIPFSYQVPEDRQRDLEKEFEVDLPAFTTYLLGIDRDWVTRTLKDAKSIASIQKLEWELATRTDSIAAFFDEKLILDPTSTVTAASLFEPYRQYCSETGLSPKHQNNFCAALVSLCTDRFKADVSSRKTKVGKKITGVRLRLEWEGDDEGDEVTRVTTQNQIFEKTISPPPSMTIGDGVTTVTTQKSISDLSPQPPQIDRPVPETPEIPAPQFVKHSEWIEYQLKPNGDIQRIELAFHRADMAKAWAKYLEFSGKIQKPHQIRRGGRKYFLLVAENLHSRFLPWILESSLNEPPVPPHRKR